MPKYDNVVNLKEIKRKGKDIRKLPKNGKQNLPKGNNKNIYNDYNLMGDFHTIMKVGKINLDY